jgi:CubicO group peptidase (beta-lactamase class C family)
MRHALASLLMLLFVGCATLQRRSVLESKIDALMHDYDTPKVPGASVIVVRNGAIAFRKSYGRADLEERVTATPATNYRLASMTKQFTAASMLLLAERGALSIDDPVRRFLPELPPYADAITIRHLLTHNSGLVDYEDVIPAGATKQLHDFDVLELVAHQRATLFPPGTKYQYSNSGYALLAMIVQRASGKTFAQFLEDNIFSPLGMNTTVAFEEGISGVANRAFGYSRRGAATSNEGEGPSPSLHAAVIGNTTGSPWIRTDQSLTSAVLGDGGIYSSVDDLVLWLRSLDEATILKPSSLALAFKPWVETGTPGVRYGFGWRIDEHRGKRTTWHTGETIGFRNAVVRFPDQHLAVVVLTNRNEGDPHRLALEIGDLW